MTTVGNKIPNVSNLLQKIDYYAGISNIENKYITTADYNKFTKYIVAERIKKEKFLKKTVVVLLI